MKLSITVWLCAAGAVACSHDTRPQQIPPDRTPPPLPYAAPPTETPLTPASGVGTPRTVSAPLVPTAQPMAPPAAASPGAPAHDTAASGKDQESLREIRELLTSNKSLATIAAQVTIVARDGRVWLRGQVNTAEQRAAIEKTARSAGGVVDVKNELVVLE